MKRIFAAVKIEPQPALLDLLSVLQQQLSADKIKWVEKENLHLTLKFFGETPEDKIFEIDQKLKQIKSEPFDLTIENLKIFGSRYLPRVIFLEATNARPFIELNETINRQIMPLGYEPDRQNFVPHLTLGRINYIADKKHFQQVVDTFAKKPVQIQHIDNFYLYESILRHSGPEYLVMETYYF